MPRETRARPARRKRVFPKAARPDIRPEEPHPARREARAGAPVYIDRGEPLPQSYPENRIVAMVRSPEQIYVYWDVETELRVAGSRRVVRVHSTEGRAGAPADEGRRDDHEPSPEACNWYFRVTPNRAYLFELLEMGGGQLRSLASSKVVATPVRWVGETGLRAPEEILHAERRPISAEDRAPGRLALARRALKVVAGPAATPSPFSLPDSARPRLRPGGRGTAAARAAAPPIPIPTPWEKLFAAAYARPPSGRPASGK
jgi:hypothetical protein